MFSRSYADVKTGDRINSPLYSDVRIDNGVKSSPYSVVKISIGWNYSLYSLLKKCNGVNSPLSSIVKIDLGVKSTIYSHVESDIGVKSVSAPLAEPGNTVKSINTAIIKTSSRQHMVPWCSSSSGHTAKFLKRVYSISAAATVCFRFPFGIFMRKDHMVWRVLASPDKYWRKHFAQRMKYAKH